jgi:hypothetical protein
MIPMIQHVFGQTLRRCEQDFGIVATGGQGRHGFPRNTLFERGIVLLYARNARPGNVSSRAGGGGHVWDGAAY